MNNTKLIDDAVNAENIGFMPLTVMPSFAPPYSRYTDITSASRKYDHSLYPPTSPKIHELLEKCET